MLTNSVKYTESGKVTLRAKLFSETTKKQKIHFSVKDTGIGLPKEKINSIFSYFEQVHESISRKKGGVGLGLAISKAIVEDLGGKIDIISEK